ncbi:hypothetical protein JTE90_024610 [Oedothorax gibbosus]|uniref:MATH domain-containing protein n=1 Tax=Oedothorax gibbosus TaxID=931172 RepID=A0AAV6UFA9_9ARAC|nr:hypothetical protein JTE90_024610 [Oedothorax gibbosus]
MALVGDPTYPDEITFTWYIHNFSRCNKNENESIISPHFCAGGIEWLLQLYPKGLNESHDFASFFLSPVSYEKYPANNTFMYVLSIRKHDGHFKDSNELSVTKYVTRPDACKYFISLYELNKPDVYLDNDILTLRCRLWKRDVDLPESVNCFAHAKIKVAKLDYLWILTDLVDTAGIPKHKFNRCAGMLHFSNAFSKIQIYLSTGDTFADDAIYFGISPVSNAILYAVYQIHLLDASRSIVQSISGEVIFQNSNSIQKFPFLSKRKLFANKESYLPVFVEKTVCYAELGCFSSGPPFYHPVYRPLSVPPQPPAVVGTTFQLYTRSNRHRPVFLAKKRGLHKTHFNPKVLTRVIIHGFNDNQYFTSWFQRLKNILLDRADENVIIVDWTKNNRLPYTVTVANSRLVGAQIANFIKHVHKTFGTSPESFHLIGHSLGAHVAGYAGERLHKLGRITGLDPAGPFFRNVPESVRLDPGDAVFVDIIHSDPGINILEGLGTPEDMGHLDFFPGGGDPPGCKKTFVRSVVEDAPTEALGNLVACQHLRANDFFIYSFNQKGCLMVGVECATWSEFLRGRCDCGHGGEKCAIMGIFSPTYHLTRHQDRRLFLKVAPERPFCVHQYQVVLHLHTLPGYKTYGYESVYADLTAIGSLEKLKAKLKIEINQAESKQTKRFLLSTDRAIGPVRSATLSLQKPDGLYADPHPIDAVVGKIEINYLYPLPREHVSSNLCRSSEDSLGPGTKQFYFSKCY